MPVWSSPSVEEQPDATLVSWQVVKSTLGDFHLLGRCVVSLSGRLSTPIVSFDTKLMRGVSKSGRIYQLVGPNGCNSDAEYLLGKVSAARAITFEYVTIDALASAMRSN